MKINGSKYIYSWVPIYKKIVIKLKEYETNHKGLLQVLETLNINQPNDEDENGKIELDDIDPFTFLSCLNKHGNRKRISILNQLSGIWNLNETVYDVCGLPSADARKSWLFPYKKDRRNNEINRLWKLYFSVLNDSVTNEQLQDIVTINSVGWTKITEAMFCLQPEEYLPFNGVVNPYLESLGVLVKFRNHDEIINTCNSVRQTTRKPFYQISYEAWLAADLKNRQSRYWRLGTTAGDNGKSMLPEMLENNVASIGWAELESLEDLPAVNKTEVQKKLEQLYYHDKRQVASRKAGEIINFYKELLHNDYVIAMEGSRVKAIGKVLCNLYQYDEGLEFPHIKVVDWIKKDVEGLAFEEGLRTTFVKLEDANNISRVDNMLNGMTPQPLKDKELNKENQMTKSLNTILYGPPGTGKTYNTIYKALSVIENKSERDLGKEDRAILKERYKTYTDKGQIVFTTFHQSMSYEDFVEGIKPIIEEGKDGERRIVYEVVDGIFKTICKKAQTTTPLHSDKQLYDFDDAWNELIEEVQTSLDAETQLNLGLLTPGKAIAVTEITNNGNLTVTPKGGNGKEYLVSYSRLKNLAATITDLSLVKNIDKEFREVIGGMNSSAYWATLNYINNKLSQHKKDEIDPEEKQSQPHVLIIDEINRGNIAAILGELITLIEPTKRTGADDTLEVVLPYSKQKFSVPSNLYIIGTMNTADRSVEALDTALRRRFSFESIQPTLEPIKEKQIGAISLGQILAKINERVLVLLSSDHLIGHSYFMDITNEDELKIVFKNKIIPLLQEYFYNDYGKIGLVLGNAFVEAKQKSVQFPKNFEYENKEELAERTSYTIISSDTWTADSFKSIYID